MCPSSPWSETKMNTIYSFSTSYFRGPRHICMMQRVLSITALLKCGGVPLELVNDHIVEVIALKLVSVSVIPINIYHSPLLGNAICSANQCNSCNKDRKSDRSDDPTKLQLL